MNIERDTITMDTAAVIEYRPCKNKCTEFLNAQINYKNSKPLETKQNRFTENEQNSDKKRDHKLASNCGFGFSRA